MQSAEMLAPVVARHFTEPTQDAPAGSPVETHDHPSDGWTVYTPSSRYEVASMQHWLDLNA